MDAWAERGRKMKHSIQIHHIMHIPTGQGLVERSGSCEHALHVTDASGLPVTNGAVECPRTIEHFRHILHLACVPLRSEVLVKHAGFGEHALHVADAARKPRCGILLAIQWLVEGRRALEHVRHVLYVLGVPAPNGMVECPRTIEHVVHVLDETSLPVPNGLVEYRGPGEHVRHVSDVVCVPLVQRAVEVRTVPEHPTHGGQLVYAPVVDVLPKLGAALERQSLASLQTGVTYRLQVRVVVKVQL